jgi:hypothetical protein
MTTYRINFTKTELLKITPPRVADIALASNEAFYALAEEQPHLVSSITLKNKQAHSNGGKSRPNIQRHKVYKDEARKALANGFEGFDPSRLPSLSIKAVTLLLEKHLLSNDRIKSAFLGNEKEISKKYDALRDLVSAQKKTGLS